MRIELDVFGEKQVSRNILRFGEHVEDPSPLWDNLREMFHRIEEQRFAAEGPGWAPLKEATIAAKERRGESTGILRATGALHDSLTGGSGGLFEADNEALRFGTDVPYAIHHQFGAPRANVPQRKVIDFGTADKRDIIKRIQRYIVTGQLYPAA